jgi:hypothetical protein
VYAVKGLLFDGAAENGALLVVEIQIDNRQLEIGNGFYLCYHLANSDLVRIP